MSGERRVRVRAADARSRGHELPGKPDERYLSIEDLDADERRRFTRAYEKLYADAESYYERRPNPRAVTPTNARSDASPRRGAHVSDIALEHGLVSSHGTAVFEGPVQAVRDAAAAYRTSRASRYIVLELPDGTGRVVVHVRSAEGDVDLLLRSREADHAIIGSTGGTNTLGGAAE